MSTLDLTADAHVLRRRTSSGVRSRIDRFRARWDYLYAALAVLADETSTDVWEITTFPGLAIIDGDLTPTHIFYGGRTYTVNGSLATALMAAGYDVLPAFTSGFSIGFEVAI